MMGFNEAYYALSAIHYDPSTLTPAVSLLGSEPRAHLKLPPLESMMIAGSFGLFGIHEWAARIPSLLAWAGTILLGVSWAKQRGYDGWFHGFLLASTPWLFFWMGRAQTDPFLTFCVFLIVVGLQQRNMMMWAAGWGLGLLTKQTILLAFPLFWMEKEWWNRRNVATLAAASVPAGLWWLYQLRANTTVFLEDLAFHINGGRTQPFSAWLEMVSIGGLLAAGTVLYAARGMDWKFTKPVWVTSLTFYAFAIIDAPPHHSYYTLPAVALFLLVIPEWRKWPLLLRKTHIPATIALCVYLAGIGGEFDKPILKTALEENPGVYVQASLWPQAEYYQTTFKVEGDGCPAAPGRTVLCALRIGGCVTIREYEGWFDALQLQRC